MFNWLRSRKLEDVLNETRKVRVHGILFTIRKVNIMNYLDGSKVLQQVYDTYQSSKEAIPPASEKKIKEHFSHVLVAGVVDPKLSFKQEDGSTFVDNLFTDWDLATELYNEIMNFTYGKKKGLSSTSQGISSSRSTS